MVVNIEGGSLMYLFDEKVSLGECSETKKLVQT